MKLETVRVVREEGRLGYHVINKADFDPEKHQLFEEDKAEKPKAENGTGGGLSPEDKAKRKELIGQALGLKVVDPATGETVDGKALSKLDIAELEALIAAKKA